MVWGYFTHFHESALCYNDVHVCHATSLCDNFLESLKCLFFLLTDMMMRIIINLQPETHGLICHQSKAPLHLLVPQ